MIKTCYTNTDLNPFSKQTVMLLVIVTSKSHYMITCILTYTIFYTITSWYHSTLLRWLVRTSIVRMATLVHRCLDMMHRCEAQMIMWPLMWAPEGLQHPQQPPIHSQRPLASVCTCGFVGSSMRRSQCPGERVWQRWQIPVR